MGRYVKPDNSAFWSAFNKFDEFTMLSASNQLLILVLQRMEIERFSKQYNEDFEKEL